MFGYFLVGFVQRRQFISSIIKSIYQIRKLNFEKEQKKTPFESLDTQRLRQKQCCCFRYTWTEGINNKEKLAKLKRKETELSNTFREKLTVEDQDYQQILISMISRQRLQYKLCHILSYLIQCFCFRNLKKMKKRPGVKEHILFNKAQEKLQRELDVITLIRTIKKFRLMAQSFYTQQDRLLLRFQKQNLLETSSSDSSDSDDNTFDTLKLMESKNPFVRLVVFGKIKKMIRTFKKESLNKPTQKLIRGIFKRKIKEFDEELKLKNQDLTLWQKLIGKDIIQQDSEKSQDGNDFKQSSGVQRINTQQSIQERTIQTQDYENMLKKYDLSMFSPSKPQTERSQRNLVGSQQFLIDVKN